MALSLAITAHLMENTPPPGLITPTVAFLQTRQYLETVRASWDGTRGCATPGFDAFRGNLEDLQREFEILAHARGTYVSDFSGAGMAMMLLAFGQWRSDNYGGMFGATPNTWRTGANHAGLVVWSPSEAFVFDPNCGGMHVRWLCNSTPRETPQLGIDVILARLAGAFDGASNKVMSRLLGAKRLSPSVLPFGRA